MLVKSLHVFVVSILQHVQVRREHHLFSAEAVHLQCWVTYLFEEAAKLVTHAFKPLLAPIVQTLNVICNPKCTAPFYTTIAVIADYICCIRVCVPFSGFPFSACNACEMTYVYTADWLPQAARGVRVLLFSSKHSVVALLTSRCESAMPHLAIC